MPDLETLVRTSGAMFNATFLRLRVTVGGAGAATCRASTASLCIGLAAKIAGTALARAAIGRRPIDGIGAGFGLIEPSRAIKAKFLFSSAEQKCGR
jgi:hypothetical protein